MNIVHPIHDRNVTKIKRALTAALPVIQEEIRRIIEGYCHPETKKRAGSIKSVTGHWFNEDTIDEQEIVRELKQLRSIQTKVQDAIEVVTF